MNSQLRSRRQSVAFAIGAVLPLVVIVAVAGLVMTSDARTQEARPDLGMAPLSDISIEKVGGRKSDGPTQLRFSATIVNVGSLPFELAALRADGGSPFGVVQRLGASEIPTPAVSLVFGGDGHNHWHVKDLERYELVRLDNGVKVGTSSKSGFCFYDTTFYRSLPGTPSQSVYRSAGCGTQESLDVTMGLSIGWGDRYPATLPDQYIDITGLANGRYRLYAEADPENWFAESDETNNATWVDLSIVTNRGGKTKLQIHGYGPAA
jgi:hypothetical protein